MTQQILGLFSKSQGKVVYTALLPFHWPNLNYTAGQKLCAIFWVIIR